MRPSVRQAVFEGYRPAAQRLLIAALEACGAWERITAFYAPAARSEKAALKDWKNPNNRATKSASPGAVFTQNRGFAVSTAVGYINTGYPVNTLADRDDNMVAVRAYNYATNNNGIAGHVGNTSFRLSIMNTSNQIGARLATAVSVVASVLQYDSRQLMGAQRVSSTEVQFFAGGLQQGANVASASTGALPSDNFTFGVPTSAQYTGMIFFAGRSLTAEQWLAVDIAVEDYIRVVSPPLVGFPNVEVATPLASTTLPDIPTYSAAGKSYTGTGLAALAAGKWLTGDDGRYGQDGDTFDATNWRPKINILNSDLTLDTSIDLYAYDSSATTAQGVCVNGDGNYCVARLTLNIVQIFTPLGAFVTSFAVTQANGLAWETATSRYYTSNYSTTRNIAVRDSTGALIDSITLPTEVGTLPIDHLCAEGGLLYVTKGSNGSAGTVYVVDIATKTVTHAYLLPNAKAIEGVALAGGDIYVLSDEWFHGVSALNTIQRYDLP